jgi:hypothetical protein
MGGTPYCQENAGSATCDAAPTNNCSAGAKRCASGTSIATCVLDGAGYYNYGAAIACGARQDCAGPAGAADCVCRTDTCTSVNPTCESLSKAVTCAVDGDGCYYTTATTPCGAGNECSNGSCKACGAIAWPPAPGWTQVSTGPGIRNHGMAYDSIRKRIVAFGGIADMGGGVASEVNGTYTWTAAAGWVTKTLGTPPSPRSQLGMAFDSDQGKLVVFGGGAGASVYGDTFFWDGASPSWTAVFCPGSCPQARKDHAMAYDSDRHVVVMFGGTGAGASALADTWQFDGAMNKWSVLSPLASPPPALHVRMAYDSVRKVMVAISNEWTDVWEYDAILNKWIDRTSSAGFGPGKRASPGLVFDASIGRTVLFGGYSVTTPWLADRWEWDGFCWRNTTPGSVPPALQYLGMAYDSDAKKIIIHGGGLDPNIIDTKTYQ